MDNNLYESNLRALEKKFAYTSGIFKDNNGKDFSAEIYPSASDTLTMAIRNNGKNTHVYSKFEPLRTLNKIYNTEEKMKECQLVFGFGLGYEIKKLIGFDDVKMVIVFIPNVAVFKDVMKAINILDIINNEKVYLIIDVDDIELEARITFIARYIIQSYSQVEIITNKTYKKLFAETINRFLKKLQEKLSEGKVNIQTNKVFADDWTQNILNAVKYFKESYSIEILENALQGIPAFVVSAGPSLNKNISELKLVNNRACIIATDTALKPLLKNGVLPHLVISVDGSDMNYNKYAGIDYENVPLVYSAKVNKKIVDECKSTKLIYSSYEHELVGIQNKIGKWLIELPSGGSVANNAYSLALYMNADPVVFVGQDLAYTNDEKHATGTFYDDKSFYMKEDIEYIESFDGKMVPTSGALKIYRDWFEKSIRLNENDRLYINGTEGGARIKGTQQMRLKEVIREYCNKPMNIADKLSDLYEVNEYYYKDKDYKRTIEYYKEQIKELQKLKRVIADNIKILEELEHKKNKTRFNLLDRMKENDKEIKRIIKEVAIINTAASQLIETTIVSVRSADTEKYKSEQEKEQRTIKGNSDFYVELDKKSDYVIKNIKSILD